MTAILPGRVLVLGLGLSGQAAAAALRRRGIDVVEADRDRGNDADLAVLGGIGLLVKSPGVPGENALVGEARSRGIPVWSEAELGYRLLPGNRIVGITGTKGKTTTVRLLGAMLSAAGRKFQLAGNEHRPISDVADELDRDTLLVCELTSFQLEDVHTLSCDVAVLLNLEPDHLDRHGSFDAYRDAKLRIFERAGLAVVPRGSGLEGIEFSGADPLPAEPRIPGEHNRENAAAAAATARLLDVADEAIGEALRDFPGVEHRLEPIAELDGVLYVNDSKATTVSAALRALAAYPHMPVRLIAGGRGKGQSFERLADGTDSLVGVYLIGESTEELARAFAGTGVPVEAAGDLETAVARAAAAARAGDVVLLSPACASFDQYENFERRGEEFRRLVQNLEA